MIKQHTPRDKDTPLPDRLEVIRLDGLDDGEFTAPPPPPDADENVDKLFAPEAIPANPRKRRRKPKESGPESN